MKVLRKRLFAFFMVFCMIVPMCAQSVSAADSMPNGGVLEDSIRVPESLIVSPTSDSLDLEFFESDLMGDDGISPYLTPTDRDMGVGIRQIRVFPTYRPKDATDDLMYYDITIYAYASYSDYSQMHGIELSKNDTLYLMGTLADKLIAEGLGDACVFAGWYLECDVEFHYKNPDYVEYQCRGTGLDAAEQPYTKKTVYPYEVKTLPTAYYYPAGVDILNDYYFIGVSGGCHYTSSLGVQLSALMQYSVSFNH